MAGEKANQMIIELANITIDIGENEYARVTLSYDNEARVIHAQGGGVPSEIFDEPILDTIEDAKQYIREEYADHPMHDLEWIKR